MTAATEIWGYRNLILNLAQRELRARYKKSLLGWLWSLINPAAMLGIYTLVFGVYLGGRAPVAGDGSTESFGLYLFAGLVVWNMFSGTVNGAIGALQGAGGLLNKVYFPPSAPAMANLLTVLLQACLEAGILALIMIGLGNVGWSFLLFPLLILELAMFSMGIGLVVSVYNVFYRDVGYLVGIAMTLFFYATPIVYSLSDVPESIGGIPARRIVSLSPLTQFVEWSRGAFYLLRFPGWPSLLGTTAASLLTLVVGWWLFNLRARNVAEEL